MVTLSTPVSSVIIQHTRFSILHLVSITGSLASTLRNENFSSYLLIQASATPTTPDMPQKDRNIIEIIWDPPEEPIWWSFWDCLDWRNSTCSSKQEGKKRCHCNTNFHWDADGLSCIEQRKNFQENVLPSVRSLSNTFF